MDETTLCIIIAFCFLAGLLVGYTLTASRIERLTGAGNRMHSALCRIPLVARFPDAHQAAVAWRKLMKGSTHA